MPKEELEKWNPDVLTVFKEITYNNLEGMKRFYEIMKGKTAMAKILLQDVRLSNLENSVSLILTSPPYGDSSSIWSVFKVFCFVAWHE